MIMVARLALLVSCVPSLWAFRTQYANSFQPLMGSDSTNAGWPFFENAEDACKVCSFGLGTDASASVDALKRGTDLKVGCVSKGAPEDIPLCPLEGSSTSSDQAGGHAGTIAKLTGKRIAKQTKAFDDHDIDETSHHHIEFSRVEYQVYMEMWCLQRLAESSPEGFDNKVIEEHPLANFALGEDPWAPGFHGICKLPALRADGEPDEAARPRLYLVQDNMLADFTKPCQLDLKLGFDTVEPWTRVEEEQEPSVIEKLTRVASKSGAKKLYKQVMHGLADNLSPSAQFGARLAGYKVFDPFVNKFEKMASKWADPMSSLPSVFNKFFDESGHVADTATFEVFRQRLLGMAAWWADHGEKDLRSVALSALFAYECEPTIGGEVIISDVAVTGTLPVMDSESNGGKADPYVVARSFPRDMLYPNVDFGSNVSFSEGTSTDANNNLKTRFSRFVYGKTSGEAATEEGNRTGNPFSTNTIFQNLTPEWAGQQFNLAHGPRAKEIVLDLWDQDTGEHDFIGRVILSLATICDTTGHRLCLPVRFCEECTKQGVEPNVCFQVERRRRSSPEATPPRLKLIDYAHLYPSKAVTSEWEADGVHEGLLSSIRELDSKTVAASGMSHEGGDRMKCPDNTASHHEVMLTLDTCKRYGTERHMKYVSWRSSVDNLGECRVCNVLVEREKTWITSGKPYQIFRLD